MEGMGGEWKGWEVKEGEWEGNGRRTEGMGCKWKGWGGMGGGTTRGVLDRCKCSLY